MRCSRLVPALITAAAVAVSPAGASAAKHRGLRHSMAAAPGHCKLTINVAPRFVQAGESAEVFGKLSCKNGQPTAAQPVTIVQRSGGAPGPTSSATTTDGLGNYRLASAPLQTDSLFRASATGVHSGARRVTVAANVSLSTPPTPADGSELLTGAGLFLGPNGHRLTRVSNRVTFAGTVSAAEQGAEVILQRQNAVFGEGWHRVDRGVVQAGGAFSIAHVFRVPGDANMRVVVRPFRFNGRGVSETRSYEVSQAQNPLLTIQSSANPLTYEQTTTISGTLGGATAAATAGTPLTLLARTRHEHAFAPVAQTTTGAGGKYEFPAQKPLQSTFYRVTGPGQLSAVLFEGVKYALTAAASPTAAQVGQPVTFSGTVTPWRAGHVVYLQAQDRSGVGFHVIQVASVNPPAVPGGPATYSFSHAFYNAGASPRKVRVKVPGDPENQGVASRLIEIALTPAATPAPEAPGNSSLPDPGQS